MEGGFQVGATGGTETDATGQLLAATVTKAHVTAIRCLDTGCVTVWRVAVVTHHERVVLIEAHCKALWTNDLAVVHQEFLSRHGHPFSALWTLEFHCFSPVVAAKIMLWFQNTKFLAFTNSHLTAIA
jgi:hypothetical protein